MTAATTGGESEYASRSTVKVAIVAEISANRSGAIRSTAWHFTHTRCGGACRAPHAWQRLPVKANFHDSARNDGAAAGRSGSGRRGGSRGRKPRHVKNVAYVRRPPEASCAATGGAGRREAIAAVVRKIVTSQPSASETTAISSSGFARSSASASMSPACAVPVLPMLAARSSATVPFAAPTAEATRRLARLWGPVTIQLLTDAALRPACL